MSDQQFAPNSADDAVGVADLEAFAEEVAAFVDRQGPVNVADLEILAEEIAAFVDKRIADVELAEAAPPVVNVAPSAANIEVNVPQQAAPIVNVETVAPQITVAPAVNVMPSTAQVVIENRAPDIVAPAVEVSVDMTPVARAIGDQTLASQTNANATDAKLDLLILAVNELARVMAAPKTLVMENGKPIGVRVKQ